MVRWYLMKLRLPASWYGTLAVRSYQDCVWHIKISHHWMIATAATQAPKQTSYILQFLWRDLTSCYNIVGPYFTCSESVDGKFILAFCVLETVKLFQTHGLKTSLLVCDGCVANLTTIKSIHGYSAAYSVLSDGTWDKFEIKPWTINSFCPQICFTGCASFILYCT